MIPRKVRSWERHLQQVYLMQRVAICRANWPTKLRQMAEKTNNDIFKVKLSVHLWTMHGPTIFWISCIFKNNGFFFCYRVKYLMFCNYKHMTAAGSSVNLVINSKFCLPAWMTIWGTLHTESPDYLLCLCHYKTGLSQRRGLNLGHICCAQTYCTFLEPGWPQDWKSAL